MRTAAFDKTGTLTRGAPEAATVQPQRARRRRPPGHGGVRRVFSTHPLASAIVAGARERGLEAVPAIAASEATAQGATATVDGHQVVVGKATYIAEEAGGAAAPAGAGRAPCTWPSTAGMPVSWRSRTTYARRRAAPSPHCGAGCATR